MMHGIFARDLALGIWACITQIIRSDAPAADCSGEDGISASEREPSVTPDAQDTEDYAASNLRVLVGRLKAHRAAWAKFARVLALTLRPYTSPTSPIHARSRSRSTPLRSTARSNQMRSTKPRCSRDCAILGHFGFPVATEHKVHGTRTPMRWRPLTPRHPVGERHRKRFHRHHQGDGPSVTNFPMAV
jgi:hypothetical protein